MHSKIAALLLPVLAAATPVPQSGSAPNPNDITIVDTSYSGNGCPQGTVSTSTSPDRTVSDDEPRPWQPKPYDPDTKDIYMVNQFWWILPKRFSAGTVITYGFDSFQTYIGPGTVPADRSKNCQLHLNLKYPGGFQYAVVDATYHGWARMDEGVTGSFITSYYFSQDAGKTSTTRMTANGGGALLTGQVYTKQDSIETTATVWSPCGTSGILNINNRISLTSKNATQAGELSNDDATVAFTQQLHVSWRKCTGSDTGSSSGGDTIGIGKPSSDVTFGN